MFFVILKSLRGRCHFASEGKEEFAWHRGLRLLPILALSEEGKRGGACLPLGCSATRKIGVERQTTKPILILHADLYDVNKGRKLQQQHQQQLDSLRGSLPLWRFPSFLRRNPKGFSDHLRGLRSWNMATSPGPKGAHRHNVVRQRLDFTSENQSADEHPKEAFMESKSVIKEKYNTASNSRAKIAVQLGEGLEVEVEESEADIAFDLNRSNNRVPDMYIRLPKYPTPIHLSRRELLKKNWKHLARMAGKANSTDKTHIVEISKQNSIQSHVKLDTVMTLVRGEMENEQAKSCYNHVDNARRGCIYPISGDKGSMQTHASNIPQFPLECKRRRTMLMHNVEFGQMARVSKSCSFVDEQNLVPLGDLQTSDFMLTFGPIKWVTKKRSKVPIRVPKPVLTEIVAGYKDLLQNLESRHQACIKALLTDARVRMKTGKRTIRKHVHLQQ